jgi:hypothetical protein
MAVLEKVLQHWRLLMVCGQQDYRVSSSGLMEHCFKFWWNTVPSFYHE